MSDNAAGVTGWDVSEEVETGRLGFSLGKTLGVEGSFLDRHPDREGSFIGSGLARHNHSAAETPNEVAEIHANVETFSCPAEGKKEGVTGDSRNLEQGCCV